MLIHEMKFVVDNYAIDKTQVDYILKSDKEYLYLNNALELFMDQHEGQYKQIFTGAHVRYNIYKQRN